MKEAGYSLRLIKGLNLIPGAMALSFNDRTTAGIPDHAFIYRGITSWLEAKAGDDYKIRPLQHQRLLTLEKITRRHAWYIVFTKDETFVVSPGVMEPDGHFEEPQAILQSGVTEVINWLKESHDAGNRTPNNLLRHGDDRPKLRHRPRGTSGTSEAVPRRRNKRVGNKREPRLPNPS